MWICTPEIVHSLHRQVDGVITTGYIERLEVIGRQEAIGRLETLGDEKQRSSGEQAIG